MRKFERLPRRLKVYIFTNKRLSRCHERLARRWMQACTRAGQPA